jgi:hypothetical protein
MLIELLILILILGLIVWLVRQFLGEPFNTAATVVCVIILIIWLLRFAGVAGGGNLRTLW